MRGRELLSWNVRRIRVERGLSQEALAADTAVDRTWVSDLERGKANPTIVVLDRLADALGVHLSVLFAEPPKEAERPMPLRGGRRPKVL